MTMYIYTTWIREAQLDSFGHVNNAAYLTLLEEARWDFVTKNGYGLNKIRELGIGPVILEVKLTFAKELCLRDTIVIETQVASYRKKIGRINQRILRDGVVCCTAEFTIGLFDLNQRKLIAPTPEWLKAIGANELST